jgi:hypothetical protein
MADQAKDSGPYQLYGRRTARAGDQGRQSRQSRQGPLPSATTWWTRASGRIASVRNRDDLAPIHVGEVTGGRDKGTDDDDGGPDA